MNDVTIVGGGLTGLATATLCARAGLRVTLLERAAPLGGRARTDLIGGHAFNQGGHALYIDGPAMRLLHALGVPCAGGKSPARGALAIARGALHPLPSGLVSMLATDLFGFGAKIETARALATIARIDPRALRDVTWEAWVAQTAPRKEVQDALGALARVTTYANAPERASAGETIAQIKLGLDPGVLYLDHGWQTLVDGLSRVASAAGVNVVCSAQAQAIARERSGLVVSTEAERYASRSVVLATGPATARTLLGAPDLWSSLTAAHAACLDVGLAALPHPQRLFALGMDRPTYYSVHSARARLAESGATIHVMKYLDPGEPHHPREDQLELEGVLDLVQPGWRQALVARRFLPSVVASNGIVMAGERRPEVDTTGIAGAFIAGDWVGGTGMLLDAALASAQEAAEGVIAYLTGAARANAHASPRDATLAPP